MTDIYSTITTILRAATNAKVYWPRHPRNAGLPLVSWDFITDEGKDITHSQSASLRERRLRVIHVASTEAGLVTLENEIRTALEGNRTDITCARASSSTPSNQEDENIFSLVKDYLVNFKL